MATSNINVALEIIDKVIKLTKKYRATLKDKDFCLSSNNFEINLCSFTLDQVKIILENNVGKLVSLTVKYREYNKPMFYEELKEIGFKENFGFVMYSFLC